jgi:tetratricopeptide (TPR) repeat protein
MPDYLLGIVLIGQGQVREAIRHFRAAARNQPRSAAVQHALGVAYGLQDDWRKAVRAFREALVLAPRRRESVLALAHVLLRREETDEAIGVLTDWLATTPGDREVQELLAHSYRIVGNYRAARRHLQGALQSMSPDEQHASDRARVLNNIGVCAARLGDHEEAADWYSRSIQAAPTSVAFVNLAKAYRELGNLDLARKVLGTPLAQNPNDPEAQLLRSVISGELGYADEAIETLQRLIMNGNAVAEAYTALGWILSDEKRDYREALRVLLEGEERFPSDSSIANNLAYVQLILGNVAEAKDVLSRVPQTEIERSVYLTATVGLLHLAEGDFQSAAVFYRAAEQLARQQGLRVLAKTVRQKMHLEFARAYMRLSDGHSAYEHAKLGLAIDARRSYHDDLLGLRGRLLTAGSSAE